MIINGIDMGVLLLLNVEPLVIFSKTSRVKFIDSYTLRITIDSVNVNFECKTIACRCLKSNFYFNEKNGFLRYGVRYNDNIINPSNGTDLWDSNPEAVLQYTGRNVMSILVCTEEYDNLTYYSMDVDTVLGLLPDGYSIIYLKEDETYGGPGYYIVETEFAKLGKVYENNKEEIKGIG